MKICCNKNRLWSKVIVGKCDKGHGSCGSGVGRGEIYSGLGRNPLEKDETFFFFCVRCVRRIGLKINFDVRFRMDRFLLATFLIYSPSQ